MSKSAFLIRIKFKLLIEMPSTTINNPDPLLFRDLLHENLNILESENNQLREQIEDMERELDFKDKQMGEMEAELKLLRNEREQFVEMGVRMEI